MERKNSQLNVCEPYELSNNNVDYKIIKSVILVFLIYVYQYLI